MFILLNEENGKVFSCILYNSIISYMGESLGHSGGHTLLFVVFEWFLHLHNCINTLTHYFTRICAIQVFMLPTNQHDGHTLLIIIFHLPSNYCTLLGSLIASPPSLTCTSKVSNGLPNRSSSAAEWQ